MINLLFYRQYISIHIIFDKIQFFNIFYKNQECYSSLIKLAEAVADEFYENLGIGDKYVSAMVID